MTLPCLRGGSVPAETRVELRSLEAFRDFAAGHPHLFQKATIDTIVAAGVRDGVFSAFFGNIPAEDVKVLSTNYREAFLARGFNARQRALLDEMQQIIGDRSVYDVSIYAHEALTPFALALRGRYPRFLGSEYAANDADKARIFPIPAIDITQSGLPAGAFDIVLSGDVLEHVPDLQAALRDTARILKPGGHLVATVPFAYGTEEATIKARLVDGSITYLTAPEYHGNPMNAAEGSLVFEIPGWSVLDDLRRAGFADAWIVFWSSAERGFAGDPGLGAVLLLVARR